LGVSVTLNGIVRGRTVQLDGDPGIPDGHPVRVTLATASPDDRAEAMRRAFGAWADDQEGLDEFLAEVRAARKQNRRPIE
jgi:hypothetical protein